MSDQFWLKHTIFHFFSGCLDAPVQLSTQSVKFPVKLTDPVTAVLYITSDYQHMQELKHTIHVKEVVDGKNFDLYSAQWWTLLVFLPVESLQCTVFSEFIGRKTGKSHHCAL